MIGLVGVEVEEQEGGEVRVVLRCGEEVGGREEEREEACVRGEEGGDELMEETRGRVSERTNGHKRRVEGTYSLLLGRESSFFCEVG